MGDFIYLVGAEDVRSAGNTIASAATDMRAAVNNLDGVLLRHQTFMDEWLIRFEAAVRERHEREGRDERSTR